MKKTVLILLVILLNTVFLSAKTTYLTPSKANKIQEIINEAASGDKIILKKGTYYLKKPIRISGKSSLTILARGRVQLRTKYKYAGIISISGSQKVSLVNLHLRHRMRSSKGSTAACIFIRKSSRIRIKGCIINRSPAYGIRTSRASDIIIINCKISNCARSAFQLTSTSRMQILKNILFKNKKTLVTVKADFVMEGNSVKN